MNYKNSSVLFSFRLSSRTLQKIDIQVIHASANNWHTPVCLVPVIP